MQDFLDSLSGKVAQKVTWVLQLLEDLDVMPSTYFKKLVGTEEIWEWLIKKTQKTPQRKIERAEAYRRDYLQRRITP